MNLVPEIGPTDLLRSRHAPYLLGSRKGSHAPSPKPSRGATGPQGSCTLLSNLARSTRFWSICCIDSHSECPCRHPQEPTAHSIVATYWVMAPVHVPTALYLAVVHALACGGTAARQRGSSASPSCARGELSALRWCQHPLPRGVWTLDTLDTYRLSTVPPPRA